MNARAASHASLQARALATASGITLAILGIVVGWTIYEYARSAASVPVYNDCANCTTTTLRVASMRDVASAIIVDTTDGARIYLPKRDESVAALQSVWHDSRNKTVRARILQGEPMDLENAGGRAATYERPDIATSLWSKALALEILLSLAAFACGSLVIHSRS